MEKTLLLRAELHNWSLIGSGDWTTVTWLIYYDKSYVIGREFNPEWDDMDHDRKLLAEGGILDDKRFEELKNLIAADPWRDPKIRCDACDGVAWIIEAFSETGNVMKTSGKLGYIYGQKALEAIVDCLPSDGMPVNAPAYINIKEGEETVADYIMI